MKMEDPSKSESADKGALSLKEEASNISTVLLEAQESLKILVYLLSPDPMTDIYLKHKSSFWRFTTQIYADQVILKLNILLTPSEDFSIAGLIKKVKTHGEFAGLVDADKILDWETKLRMLHGTIKKITVRRNKRIAHKDRGHTEKMDKPLGISELKTVVALVQSILKEIYMATTFSSFMIEEPIGSPVEDLIKIMFNLNEYRRIELKPLFDEARKHGLTDELPKSEHI